VFDVVLFSHIASSPELSEETTYYGDKEKEKERKKKTISPIKKVVSTLSFSSQLFLTFYASSLPFLLTSSHGPLSSLSFQSHLQFNN